MPIQTLLDRERTVAPAGFNRWLIPPAALGVHLSIGEIYGFSVFTCLPSGMVGPDAAGTGTVMRVDTLRRYTHEAGFSRVDVLPIEDEFWRFYLLRP